jgi:VanZ family protein
VSIPGGLPDSTAHSLAYLGLSLVVTRAVAGGLPRRFGLRVAALSVLITVAYGASDEIHQWFVPGRTADWRDLLADIVGALTGTIACWGWGIISTFSEPTRGHSRDEL